MNTSVSKDIQLEEKTAELSKLFLQKAREKYGYDIFITEGLRTQERQKLLYSQGRNKPGKIVTYVDGVNNISDHQLGIAFDIAFKGNELYPKDNEVRNNLSNLATEIGLKSGWKERGRDKPHFRYDRIEKVVDEVGKEYGISSDFLYCLSVSETSGGKNLKSKNNFVNAGNHDSGETKSFDSERDNFNYIADRLVNGEYLSQWTKVAELSCGGRIEVLGRNSCKRKDSDYFYASDEKNRHKNMQKCLEKRLGTGDYLNWEYK